MDTQKLFNNLSRLATSLITLILKIRTILLLRLNNLIIKTITILTQITRLNPIHNNMNLRQLLPKTKHRIRRLRIRHPRINTPIPSLLITSKHQLIIIPLQRIHNKKLLSIHITMTRNKQIHN